MSTFYEIYCRTCGESGGIYADRRPSSAEDALRCAAALAVFGEAIGGKPAPELEVSFSTYPADLEFFVKHKGHDLFVMDGYGVLLGQCRRYTNDKPCALACDHEGDCNVTGPFWVRWAKKDAGT